MTDRIVEVAHGPVRISLRLEQLVIERDGHPPVTTPVAEIAGLVLSTPQVQFTQAVLAAVAAAGGSVVVCDGKYLPAAMLLPLQAHFVQTERFAAQTQLSEPRRKRLWQRIVATKIRAQSRLLLDLRGEDAGLGALANRVRSGDPENLEAQASRRYWPRLFGNFKFRRDRTAPDQNRHLNYGYTVLRALVSRALCAAGLHPSFGLMHCNRYDAFSLASDFMEPFRPVIDRAVAGWLREHDPMGPLDPETKAWLIGAVQARFQVQGEARTLSDVLFRSASDLAQAILRKAQRLELPDLGPPCPAD
ncbi:MAG: type II CRISPR-associated endonuclease Cas1 [Acidobacteria bacterium]|nr:type II CRISPR-associated endonuclease Cas1 [Acidobacteriota bacterium]